MFPPVLVAALALAAQAPASAPASAPTTSAQAAAGSNVVCRMQTDTGTRFGHRVCHTAAEWQAISTQAGQDTSFMQHMGSMTGGPH